MTFAQESRSTNFIIKDTTVGQGSVYSSSASFRLLSGVQQIVGSSATSSFGGKIGFEYFPYLTTPILSATSSDESVSLSWTSALVGSGFGVSGYEIGQSATPGGPYMYTNVGNVLTYQIDNLNNGTTYFYVVRTLDNIGHSISTSSQIFATPVGTTIVTNTVTTSGGGGGGGGGGFYIPPPTGTSTGVFFSGRAYPRSEVTLLKDAQVVAQTVAGDDAAFTIKLTNIAAGNYVFSVYGEDKNGIRSSTLNFPVGVVAGSATNINGIFVAPTITTDKEQVRKGDNIGIFGISAPKSDITIEVNSDTQHFAKTNTDANGVYFYNFDSSLLEYGDHSTRSKSATSSEISTMSKTVAFKVGDTNIERGVTKKCPAKGDVNNDCRVNLVDFSIAAFWYNKELSDAFKTIEKEKLNGDGKVNIIDFSVMAFYWTG